MTIMLLTIACLLGFVLGGLFQRSSANTISGNPPGRTFRILCYACLTQLMMFSLLSAAGLAIPSPPRFLPYAALIGGALIGTGIAIIMLLTAHRTTEKRPYGLWGVIFLTGCFLLGARFGIKGFFAIYPDLPSYYFAQWPQQITALLHPEFFPQGNILILLLLIFLLQKLKRKNQA